jgi:hypothetical protein
MNNLFCFIPTKSRLDTNTYKLFDAVGIKVYHFIEPQEFNKYQIPNKINIGEDDKGITFVRNFMLNYAKNMNLEWVIFCDDDVKNFGYFCQKTKKTITSGASIWLDILEKVKILPFEMVGINYCQYAWLEKAIYSINKKFAEVCVLINCKKINWEYNNNYNLKEDRDFQLQTIKNGNGVLRFNFYWFQCPAVGTNKGGLHDMYKANKDKEGAVNIVKKYHPFAKLQKKGDRIDAKIDISGFAKSFNKLVK